MTRDSVTTSPLTVVDHLQTCTYVLSRGWGFDNFLPVYPALLAIFNFDAVTTTRASKRLRSEFNGDRSEYVLAKSSS